jgi:GDP-L-fucose synthase
MGNRIYKEFLYVDDLADACVYLKENIEAEEVKKYN